HMGVCLSWGRWEDHGRSSGKWWSGVKMGESGVVAMAGKRLSAQCIQTWGRDRVVV
nr:hypothetical protein [Tanacetum cinerariifolium]